MNKQPLPKYDFETLFEVQEEGKLQAWLDSRDERKDKTFRIPVTFTLSETLGTLGECFYGFEDPRAADNPTKVDYSDSRMGMGVEMQMQNKSAAEDGLKRGWLIGTWDTEGFSFFRKPLVFFVQQVKAVEEGSPSEISLGHLKKN